MIVRLVGNAMKVTGNILTAEGFDEWLQSEGKERFQAALERTSVRWCLGNQRAKKSLKKEASSTFSSEVFQAALNARTEEFPGIIRALAFAASRVPALVGPAEKYGSSKLLVVPRAPVRDYFGKHLIVTLADAAEISSYRPLAEHQLQRVADASEEELFAQTQKEEPLQYGEILVDVDQDYEWPGWRRGHYYVVDPGLSHSLDLTKPKQRKQFMKDVGEFTNKKKQDLGELGREEKERLVPDLKSELETLDVEGWAH